MRHLELFPYKFRPPPDVSQSQINLDVSFSFCDISTSC